MNVLDILSNKIANILGKYESQDDIEVYAFVVHIFLSELLFNIICVPLAILCHVFVPYCIVYAVWCMLRKQFGGYHADKEYMCITISIIMFALTIFFATLLKEYFGISMILSIICYMLLFPKMPVFGKNTVDKGEEANKQYKRNSFINFIILQVINTTLIVLAKYLNIDLSLYSSCISFSIMSAIFMATKFAEYILDKESR